MVKRKKTATIVWAISFLFAKIIANRLILLQIKQTTLIHFYISRRI